MPKQIINQAINTILINPDGTPTSEFFTLIEQLANLEILNDPGSPEGVVFAQFKTLYWDDTNSDLYFKSTNQDLNTGWVLIGP